jgi:quinol monooxygenase YgiN
MLIIAGTIKVDPSQREDYLASVVAAMQCMRAEPGCLEYVMSSDPLENGTVRLFELWASRQDFTTHFAGVGSAPRHPAVAGWDAREYEISSHRPLGG